MDLRFTKTKRLQSGQNDDKSKRPKDYWAYCRKITALECGEYAFVVSNGEDISDDKYILNYVHFNAPISAI